MSKCITPSQLLVLLTVIGFTKKQWGIVRYATKRMIIKDWIQRNPNLRRRIAAVTVAYSQADDIFDSWTMPMACVHFPLVVEMRDATLNPSTVSNISPQSGLVSHDLPLRHLPSGLVSHDLPSTLSTNTLVGASLISGLVSHDLPRQPHHTGLVSHDLSFTPSSKTSSPMSQQSGLVSDDLPGEPRCIGLVSHDLPSTLLANTLAPNSHPSGLVSHDLLRQSPHPGLVSHDLPNTLDTVVVQRKSSLASLDSYDLSLGLCTSVGSMDTSHQQGPIARESTTMPGTNQRTPLCAQQQLHAEINIHRQAQRRHTEKEFIKRRARDRLVWREYRQRKFRGEIALQKQLQASLANTTVQVPGRTRARYLQQLGCGKQ